MIDPPEQRRHACALMRTGRPRSQGAQAVTLDALHSLPPAQNRNGTRPGLNPISACCRGTVSEISRATASDLHRARRGSGNCTRRHMSRAARKQRHQATPSRSVVVRDRGANGNRKLHKFGDGRCGRCHGTGVGRSDSVYWSSSGSSGLKLFGGKAPYMNANIPPSITAPTASPQPISAGLPSMVSIKAKRNHIPTPKFHRQWSRSRPKGTTFLHPQ